MSLYVLNVAALTLDEHQLSARARNVDLPASERKAHLDYPSEAEAQTARDLEAVITGALNAAGCRVNWVRVDFITGHATDELDVQFVTDETQAQRR